MKKLSLALLAMALIFGGWTIAQAQENGSGTSVSPTTTEQPQQQTNIVSQPAAISNSKGVLPISNAEDPDSRELGAILNVVA